MDPAPGSPRYSSLGYVQLLDVVLSDADVVEPDLLFVAGDQAGILTEQNIQGAPALVVEVLSKHTRNAARVQAFLSGPVPNNFAAHAGRIPCESCVGVWRAM